MAKQVSYIWCKLIQFFERNNYIHNGLTLPYLIGAIDLLEGRTLSLKQLISELIDTQGDKRSTIMLCDHIGEYVIGILDSESEMYYKKFKTNSFKIFENLIVLDSSLSNCKTVINLVNIMEQRYNQIINSKNYSKVHGQWTKFIEDDLNNIRTFKNNLSQ